MKTSVLIIAHNEETHIGKCVESLLNQTKKPDEIVLIVHNCTDSTAQIAKETARDFPIKIFELSGKPGIVSARLEGLNKVSGDIILCIDGDSFASENWAQEMEKSLSEGNVLVSSFVKMKGNIFASFSNIFNRLKFRKAKNVSRWIWGPSLGFWGKDKEYVKEVLKESEILSSKLGLSRNPDDLWLALFMKNKGKISLVDQAFVTQNTKEKSVASALKRNRENMKNGDKIEKYFNNKPNNNMFLYHKKRAEMQGDTLYPLNTLKEMHPEISTEIIKKYGGREWLLNTKIPRLDCLWNDVIHLTAVHPSKMYDALLEAGQELKDFKWFKIPIESLNPDKMIVYLQKGHMVGGKTLLDEDFSDFDINKMNEYAVIGDKTKEYFKRRIQNNESVLMFHMVPHILYKGNIDIKGMEIIPTIPRE